MLSVYVFRYTLLIISTLKLVCIDLYVYLCDDQMYDTDRSGFISKDELASLLRVTDHQAFPYVS